MTVMILKGVFISRNQAARRSVQAFFFSYFIMVSFNHVTSDRWYERYHNNYFWRTNTILPGALKAAYVQHRSKVCNTECYRSISGTRCLQEQCSKSLFTSAEPAFSLMFSPRGDWSETERERPIKMPPSFSLHSSLVSPHEFIWWQTIPTPPSLSVCTQTYTHSCISSIKMIHREAPHGWHFSKWGMMPVKSSHQWYLCQWLCFLIHACRFSPLLRLRVVLREVSDPHLQISLYHLHLSTFPPPPPPHTFLLAWVIDHYLWPICIPL